MCEEGPITMSGMTFRKIGLAFLIILFAYSLGFALLYFSLFLIEVVSHSFYTSSYFIHLAGYLIIGGLSLVGLIWSGRRLFSERKTLKLAGCALLGLAAVVSSHAYGGKISYYLTKPYLIRNVEAGNLRGVEILLLADGIDPNTKGRDGLTALMSAAYTNRKEITELLIAQGADVNEKHREYRFTALNIALLQGHTETADILIDNGAEVDASDDDGWTPLMHTTCEEHYDHVNMTLYLLTRGADVNAKTDSGKTAVSIASTSGNVDAINTLADYGADLNAVDDRGWTPLMRAVCVEEIDAVGTLLLRGAEVNFGKESGKTALALAKKNDQPEIVELLKYAGAVE